MSLIKCPECGKEFSDRAVSCPNCGYPVPQKKVPVHIERNSTMMLAVGCYVYVDGVMVGELKPKKSLDCELTVGSHSISIESDVSSFGYSAADTRKLSGEQFNIDNTTKKVYITIKTKGSWTGGTGKCVVDSIVCQ